MKALFLALGCVVAVACGSTSGSGDGGAAGTSGTGGSAGASLAGNGPQAGQAGESASGGQPGAVATGTGGEPEAGGEGGASPVDKLFGPCGRRDCSGLQCLQKICTFDCLGSGTAAPGEYCHSLGAMCNGDSSGIVSCQPQ